MKQRTISELLAEGMNAYVIAGDQSTTAKGDTFSMLMLDTATMRADGALTELESETATFEGGEYRANHRGMLIVID